MSGTGAAGRGGAIWAPSGIGVDSAGFLYVATGNAGTTTFDYGDSVIRLAPDPLRLDSYFAATNWAHLAAYDWDLGSVAPALLNDGLLFAVGKEGVGYLLRANALPGIGNELFSAPICGNGAYGGTAYVPPYVFVSCQTTGLARITVDPVAPRFTVDWYSGATSSDPAARPPIVAGGVVWSVAYGENLLHAFSILTGADVFPPISLAAYGTPTHFSSLATANSQLFVPTGARVVAFRLAGPSPTPTPVGQQRVTFDGLSPTDQPLNGQYPPGVIDWGNDVWLLAGPYGGFTGNSISFNGPGPTAASFTFVSPRRLVSIDVTNGGTSSTTIGLTCGTQSTQALVTPGQVTTITTGWATLCASVTVESTNGWDTNFTNLTIDASGALPSTLSLTPTPTTPAPAAPAR